MSHTFTLTGRSNSLSSDYYPPIELNPNYEYSLALTGFHTFNNIPNIEENRNNKFYISNKLGVEEIFSIPTGTYELSDIESYLQKNIAERLKYVGDYNHLLSLKPNNNTLKCEFQCSYDVNFKSVDSLGETLGFEKKNYIANIKHTSQLPVEIVNVLILRLECNIISGSYYNNKISHTLYEFAIDSNPGYSVDVQPSNLIYLPIVSDKRYIDNISIQILDQDSRPVNFRDEKIVVRMHLRCNRYGSII